MFILIFRYKYAACMYELMHMPVYCYSRNSNTNKCHFSTGTTVHAQWLMTNPLSQPFRPLCRPSESQDEHWTTLKKPTHWSRLYLLHSSAMIPANHFICQMDKLRYAIPLVPSRVEPHTYLMAGRRAIHLSTPHHNLASHTHYCHFTMMFWYFMERKYNFGTFCFCF